MESNQRSINAYLVVMIKINLEILGDRSLDANTHNALLVRIASIMAGELDSCVRIADAIIDCVLPQCLIIFGDILI